MTFQEKLSAEAEEILFCQEPLLKTMEHIRGKEESGRKK
jgi:hypothetical protein